MGKASFQKVLEDRNELLHRKAVLEEVVAHLRKFVDTDAAPAKHGIRTEGGGMVVPQSLVERMINEFEAGPMAEIEKTLNNINLSEVAEHVTKEGKEGSQGKAQDRKGSPRQPRTKP